MDDMAAGGEHAVGRGGRQATEGCMQEQPDGDSAALSFGFLTTLESPVHGLFGGYLVVDTVGRPIEFHCTAPVKVSRAQQILYGASLDSHLHGRQVGGALLAEGKATPAVVLTDNEAMLHVRPHTTLPVALVWRGGDTSDAALSQGLSFNGAVVRPHAHDADQSVDLAARLATLAAAVDLCEPFERIRAALEEAARL
jgi:hypothetical protein